MAQFGRALGLGPRGRTFESCYSDVYKKARTTERGPWNNYFKRSRLYLKEGNFYSIKQDWPPVEVYKAKAQ